MINTLHLISTTQKRIIQLLIHFLVPLFQLNHVFSSSVRPTVLYDNQYDDTDYSSAILHEQSKIQKSRQNKSGQVLEAYEQPADVSIIMNSRQDGN